MQQPENLLGSRPTRAKLQSGNKDPEGGEVYTAVWVPSAQAQPPGGCEGGISQEETPMLRVRGREGAPWTPARVGSGRLL